MALTLTIGNLDKMLAEIKQAPADIDRIINNEFKAFGQNVVTDAQRLVPKNESRLVQNISDKLSNLEVRISANTDYAAFVEFGTKSFAAAHVATLPVDWQAFAAEFKGAGSGTFKELVMKITKWVQLKGIPAKAAYPIALKIITNGVRAQPYLFPAFEKNKIELINNLKKQLNAK